MATDLQHLEMIVEKIGEAVIATTVSVERLAEKVDALAIQVQNQGQQQSYQIFALTEALQTLVDSQYVSKEQLDKLTETLRIFVSLLQRENGQ
ncbi:conserved hypothetical protein [Gloeothece citriformis PCC 7424]|uniref:Uncharacterized protein n=1 Tax=Gloeothece citriformis (strain PCC 7424) TaxID=65393 RepID=B7KAP5_GLOC7|nr:hypothetical protein [Gloeothece citriformis]ACK68717.1 conserved hypothetical protein [Gloeothece citriformis PCC 7424]